MATTVWHNNAEGGPSNLTTVTQGSGGNTGGASGDFITTISANGGTIQFNTAAAEHSTYGYRLARPTSGTGQMSVTVDLGANQSDFVGQHWMTIPTQPSVSTVVFKGYTDSTATTTSWAVAISTTGKLIVMGGSASTTLFTSTATVPAATRVRWEYEAVSGTSIRVVAYSGDSTTVLADSGVISSTLIGVTRSWRIGLLTTGSAPVSLDWDDARLGSGPGFFGLTTSAVPTELVSNAGAWVADGAASIPLALADGNAATAMQSVTGGTAVTSRVGFGDQILPEGSVTVSYDVELDVASPVWDLTVTAYLGGVSKGSQTVTVNSTTSSPKTFTVSGLTGDMSTFEVGFSGTSH